MRIGSLTKWLIALFLVCTPFSHSLAQYYFGKNKIQYSHFDWQVLQTEHFNVYYYSGEEEVAHIAAYSIERSYRVLEDKFNMPLTKQIPLIIYSSPNYFDQTNVIPQILPENVAGVTEFLKGRMVVPFNGSYADFDRTLRHELVHVFTYAKLAQVNKDHKKIKMPSLPLWFIEGIAEYWSGPWSSKADMIASDAILSGLSFNENSIYSISGSFLMYKLGESLCGYMADTYGDEKIMMIFENWWKGKTFREVIEYTFGVPLSEIFDGWLYHLRKKYFPTIADAEFPDRVSKALTPRGFSVKPVIARLNLDGSENKDYLVYKANKLGYSGIYLQESGNARAKCRTLVKGERSSKFESLHLLDSDISVNRDGKLAFASRHYERDVLYIYDLTARKIERKLDFPGLVIILSPSWSSDGKRIVFAGCRMDGAHDIYLYDFTKDSLVQLCDDIYYDSAPVFTPDGSGVLFASDRTGAGEKGYRNLFEIDIATGEITQVTWGECSDATPSYSPDGAWIVFQSDRGGLPNIYALDTLGNMFRVGKFASGILDPSFTPSGDSLVFSAFLRSGIGIYSMPFDDSLFIPVENEPLEYAAWEPGKIQGKAAKANFKYSNDFSFDIAQSAVAYDAFYGTIGGFQMAYSDMLGNQQFYFLLYNAATTRSDFFSSFNVAASYINKTGRINFGGGIFHLYGEYDNRLDGVYDERQFGGMGLVSYPISKYRRFELTSVLRKSERYFFVNDSTRHAVLSTSYISYIKDNSLWDMSGPIDGTRYNLTLGFSFDLKSGKSFARIAFADYRKYIRLGKWSAFASRLFGYTSAGEEPQRLYLGGSWSLRGYNRRQFYGRNLLLWSNELRFPLIDNLFIGFPLGRVGFSGIRGALFWDTGNAWDDDFDRFHGALGFGARVALGYMAVLRFDFARKTDYRKISNKWDFDFFFGWNF